MPPKDREPSSTPVPTTEPKNDGSQLPKAEWDAMSKVLNAIYDHRTEDGFDPSKLFHRKVNKRVIPEYYDTIKEPMALSTLKQKIHQKTYNSFKEFVRDFALIPYNAQVFNVPESGAFQDALVIKEQIEKQLQLLVKDGIITQEVATLPDLGEIPTYTPAPIEEAAEGEAEDDEESDEEGEGEDEEDGDEDDDGRKKKRRGARSGASIAKRDAAAADDDEDGGKRARGRPPKLLTPMEARMQTILKGIRKPKNNRGQLMIKHFDRLPDKVTLPDYYVEIKNPIAYEQLKRKVKRKKYKTLEEFMADVNLMFNNAKQYNKDDSPIYKEAAALQVEAGKLYDTEIKKPDESFADEEGKILLPNGILHNGELYKVGDWIHIQNINDLTKPVPAQIYRTYKDKDGSSQVNVCWYYRPEQTVHRHDKHFFPNEVVKTGRYRDHPIEAVEGKCFIMFYTRYFKGRPRSLPEGTEIYVCQSRYNESAHQFNTIKTWASCLPDEVRDRDYEMDLFDHPRKMKKFPSPIAYLLKDEQTETDELPKVQWGTDGAPPKIGAVHKRPRNEKDSPPPEPTPPPPPKMPTPPPRQQAPTPQTYTPALAQQQQTRPQPTTATPSFPNFTHPRPHLYQQFSGASAAPSPAPAAGAAAAALNRTTSLQSLYQQPSTPQQNQAVAPQRTMPPTQTSYGQASTPAAPPNPAAFPPRPPTANYRDPPPIEVYTLPDAANLSIPNEIREQYQRDEFGRVLFFTTPPVSADQTGAVRGHSVRYLAEKARRQEMINKKRKEREAEKEAEEQNAKKARLEAEQKTFAEIEELKKKALDVLDKQLATAVASELTDQDLEALTEAQKATLERNQLVLEHEKQRKNMRSITLGSTFFADDWDSRLVQ
ncbi:Chromatin structure-remodeling complex subunit RSC1 [Fulvia fulva]|uniref:Chromatin structure-remodeling complex subunit RSC1 n=1 Tax=Passalora fulva TaxID=5499 RepID=A0A9Q8PJD6_PASFU|nr:Chromatin structure-remodeling complex subunit RSC1 [Fulvia fulva]KAK4613193.1 Chromatin structure-remodeling complex subunit RSC1 [Fulvia fulva]UJO23495.1 Chromatin structure-remodeling complex subunit RSC1 [Fulvia fulva]WPV36545.1 Chromatin structure-remodeling complex subunit RSC1 [Fulvia fulva]